MYHKMCVYINVYICIHTTKNIRIYIYTHLYICTDTVYIYIYILCKLYTHMYSATKFMVMDLLRRPGTQ